MLQQKDTSLLLKQANTAVAEGGKNQHTLRNGQGSAHSSSLRQLELAQAPHPIQRRTAPSMPSQFRPWGIKLLALLMQKAATYDGAMGEKEV